MTTKGEWVAYTGDSKQIAEMRNCNHGFILMSSDGMHSDWIFFKDDDFSGIDTFNVTHYWIIPDDPLREMKIRQAMTGQPVWVRRHYYRVIMYTTTPDWNIPNAEYSFTAFEE